MSPCWLRVRQGKPRKLLGGKGKLLCTAVGTRWRFFRLLVVLGPVFALPPASADGPVGSITEVKGHAVVKRPGATTRSCSLDAGFTQRRNRDRLQVAVRQQRCLTGVGLLRASRPRSS